MLHLFLQCCCLLFWWEWKRVVCWWMSFVCCFFCLHHANRVQWVLCLISMHHSVMLLLRPQSCSLLIWWKWKRVDDWWMPFMCCLVYSPLRLSWTSVVFDFNASLNDVAPASPFSLSVDLMRMEMSWLLMDAICVFFSFVFTTQIKCRKCCVWFQCITQCCCSCVSNVVACLVDVNGKEWFVDGCHLCVVSFVFTMQIEFSECSVWFQCIAQWCGTRVFNVVFCWFDGNGKEGVVDVCHFCVVSFVFTTQIEFTKCFVGFQCITQWCCSCASHVVACWFDMDGKELIVDKRFLRVISFMFTVQMEFCECCVWFQCITQWCCSCASNYVSCWCKLEWTRETVFVSMLISMIHREESDLPNWFLYMEWCSSKGKLSQSLILPWFALCQKHKNELSG